jgi:hypothetical protein
MSASNSTSNVAKSKKTLDTQHNIKLTEFHHKAEQLVYLKNRLSCLTASIDDLESKRKSSPTDKLVIEKLLGYKDELDILRRTIDELENVDNEIDYLTNTAPILFKYYDIVEKGKPEDNTNKPIIGDKSILKWLVKNKEQETTPNKEDRASLLDKYMALTDETYIKNIDTEIQQKCHMCGSCNLNIMLNDGIMFCNDCSCVEYIIVDHDRPSYKDPPKEISYFSYKRINHFNEWLNQIQGKETTEIPEEIYDAILMEMKKQRFTNLADLKLNKVREILKQLGFHKYYEHSPHILHKLNGLPILNLEPEIEEKLRTMFKLIQPPFLKYMPNNRKNFLSYPYVIHKSLQLLGKDEYLHNFHLLKSRDKLHQQDMIWKKICEELGWHFIRSI